MIERFDLFNQIEIDLYNFIFISGHDSNLKGKHKLSPNQLLLHDWDKKGKREQRKGK